MCQLCSSNGADRLFGKPVRTWAESDICLAVRARILQVLCQQRVTPATIEEDLDGPCMWPLVQVAGCEVAWRASEDGATRQHIATQLKRVAAILIELVYKNDWLHWDGPGKAVRGGGRDFAKYWRWYWKAASGSSADIESFIENAEKLGASSLEGTGGTGGSLATGGAGLASTIEDVPRDAELRAPPPPHRQEWASSRTSLPNIEFSGRVNEDLDHGGILPDDERRRHAWDSARRTFGPAHDSGRKVWSGTAANEAGSGERLREAEYRHHVSSSAKRMYGSAAGYGRGGGSSFQG